MNNLSSHLSDLTMRAQSVQENVGAFKKSTKEKQLMMVKEAKAKAKAQRKEFREKITELREETQTFWLYIQEQHQKSVKKSKKAFSNFKKKMEAKNAERYATIVEEDAAVSILFALNSIAEAERLVIEALNARVEAESLKESANPVS